MFNKILVSFAFLFSFTALATDGGLSILRNGTTGLEEFSVFLCSVKSNSGEVEKGLLDLEKTVLADSKRSALLQYVNSIASHITLSDGAALQPVVMVRGEDQQKGRKGQILQDWIKEVRCELFNPM